MNLLTMANDNQLQEKENHKFVGILPLEEPEEYFFFTVEQKGLKGFLFACWHILLCYKDCLYCFASKS